MITKNIDCKCPKCQKIFKQKITLFDDFKGKYYPKYCNKCKKIISEYNYTDSSINKSIQTSFKKQWTE